MGAGVFHGRVRDGIGCIISAMTTGPPGRSSVVGDGTSIGVSGLVVLCVCGWLLVVSGCAVWCCARLRVFSCEDPGRCGGEEVISIGRLGPLG